MKNNNLLIGIIVALLVVLAFVVYFLLQKNEYTSSTDSPTVSGTFDVNGVVPQGSTIAIYKKVYNSDDKLTEAASGFAADDGGAWSIGDLETGESYEIVGQLMSGDKTIAVASPITVTAPATEETLVFNVPGDISANRTVTVSGTVLVNGYIPAGSSVTLQSRVAGSSEWGDNVTELPATRSQVVSNPNAIEGQTYEVIGSLFNSSGQRIGSSQILTVTAPAANELLSINSQATPPAAPTPTGTANTSPTPVPGNSTISGTINFNGAAPANSRIVIFQKAAGQNNYTVAVNNVTPLNGTTWTWNGATNGTWYTMLAVLKQAQSNGTDQDIADSQTITVAAPASNQTFTINSGMSLPAPTGSMSIVCGNQNQGANTWNATVSFQAVPGAQSYWYQIGTSNGGSELLSQTQNSNGNPQQGVNATFNNGTTYYARYAYANVQNAQAGSSNFSAFSNTQSFVCN